MIVKHNSRAGTNERVSTAYHEAGHAVVALAVGVAVRKVTIVPTRHWAGRCHLGDGRHPVEIEKEAMISLAGLIAQRMSNPRGVWSYHDGYGDHIDAVDIALTLNDSEDEADAFLRLLEIRTLNILRGRWPLVKVLATELLAKNTLGSKDVARADNRVDFFAVEHRSHTLSHTDATLAKFPKCSVAKLRLCNRQYRHRLARRWAWRWLELHRPNVIKAIRARVDREFPLKHRG